MRNRNCLAALGLFLCFSFLRAGAAESPADPLSWLEDLKGKRSMEWVQDRNRKTIDSLKRGAGFSAYYAAALQIQTETRASDPQDKLYDGQVYRLLQDTAHPYGLWQRIPLDSYLGGAAKWQRVLDIDRLGREVHHPVSVPFGVVKCLGQRCIIPVVPIDRMNDFGAQPHREFDLESRTWVKSGFVLPAIRNQQVQRMVEWKDPDTLYVLTIESDGSAPQAGGAAGPSSVVKEWSRGTPCSAARVVFRDQPVFIQTLQGAGGRKEVLVFATGGAYRFRSSGSPQKLLMPVGATPIGLYQDQWIFWLHGDATLSRRRWPAGSVISLDESELTSSTPVVHALLEPSIKDVEPVSATTASGVLIRSTEYAQTQVSLLKFSNGIWHRQSLQVPDFGNVDFGLTAPDSEIAVLRYQSFSQAPQLYRVDTQSASITAVQPKAPSAEDSLITERLWATSSDGTRVPYIIMRPRDLPPDGTTPTILQAYGNYGAIDTPYFDAHLRKFWLDKGRVYVWATVRGGGELGPEWFVKRAERRHTYEDFVAVAEDLIRRKITSPPHLGIRGHSMGGCLVGVMLNQRPDLFNAGISENGVLDQLYHARIGEGLEVWGSLDIPEDKAFLDSTSPYQNLRKRDAFPPPLIMTSTNDSIPAFEARKYVAKLDSFGLEAYFHETPTGGHGFGTTPEQAATHHALVFSYLEGRLVAAGQGGFQ